MLTFLYAAHEEPYSVWSNQSNELADVGFWDFAGQKEFYATHQVFLSRNAVYLLVTDISKEFKKKTYNTMIENQFDCIGGMFVSLKFVSFISNVFQIQYC